jgi:hypothetical protein
MGVLTNCMRAGQLNCAMAAFSAGVAAIESGIEGAMSAGMLKEAKIVMLSRRQKSVYEILGTLGAPTVEGDGWQEAGVVAVKRPFEGDLADGGCGCGCPCG